MITEQKDKFALIYDYLYHGSSLSSKLTAKEHNFLFSLGDGYGKMTINQLITKGLTWDWSHIRDSSEVATDQIYEELTKILTQKILS